MLMRPIGDLYDHTDEQEYEHDYLLFILSKTGSLENEWMWLHFIHITFKLRACYCTMMLILPK